MRLYQIILVPCVNHIRMTSVKSVTLNVPSEYHVNPWFFQADAEEVALVLDLASRLPRVVEHERNEIEAKLYAARDDATREAIRKVLKEATNKADAHVKQEMTQLQMEIQKLKSEKQAILDANKISEDRCIAANQQIASLRETYEIQLAQKDNHLQLELAKTSAYEKHLTETTDIKIDTVKREMALEHTQHLQKLQHELNLAKFQNETLRTEQDSLLQAARQDEINKASTHVRELEKEHTAAFETLRAAKVTSDDKLVEAATEKCKLAEEMALIHSKHAEEQSHMQAKIHTLTTQVAELQSPMARGNCGEWNIAQTLRDIGYHVEDTSEGDLKMQGYLDLLVKPERDSTENMRIAIEGKNKKNIKKASQEKVAKRDKDLDDDIETFKIRAQQGIKNGLFDAAIFVSIRAHTKMGAPVVLSMFEDTTNRPLAPVTYIGPEKGKNATPITQEQLETHVYMMFHLLEQCHIIRSDLCNGLKDQELDSFQILFDQLGGHLNKTFADLRKQEHLIDELRTNLTSIRCKCIQMFRSLCNVNSHIPWLQRKIEADWLSVYEDARQKSLTSTEATVWNNLSRNKATIEHSIGKEAMQMAIRMENNTDDASQEQQRKRVRQDDV